RLVRAWRDNAYVDAWLVPVNPLPPRGLRFTTKIKYLRTVVTELTYVPQLVRELARADIVHVFSASYVSFLLAPLPAMLVAPPSGDSQLPQRRSARSPRAIGDRARGAAARRSQRRAVGLPRTGVRVVRHLRDRHSEHRRSRTIPIPSARPAPSTAPLHAQLR